MSLKLRSRISSDFSSTTNAGMALRRQPASSALRSSGTEEPERTNGTIAIPGHSARNARSDPTSTATKSAKIVARRLGHSSAAAGEVQLSSSRERSSSRKLSSSEEPSSKVVS